MHIGNEENVQQILKHETHCAGSDAILHGKSTHPRVSRSETSGVECAVRCALLLAEHCAVR
jgi:hypothetical protein